MKVGIIGLGKIGMPVATNLLASGHIVLGYQRGPMDAFTAKGGQACTSPADLTAQADIVFSCMPSADALAAVMNGDTGIIAATRKGQIIVEIGSHPVEVKQAFVAPLAAKGAIFLDGEVAGTPGMVAARKANIFLAGPADAVAAAQKAVAGFSDLSMHIGDFGAATRIKLVNNILVALDIAGAAQALAFGLHLGLDKDIMIQALTSGSGASTQLGIRGPWMVNRQFLPLQGPAPTLKYYLDQSKKVASALPIQTDILDCLIDVYARAIPLIGQRDVAAMIEFFETPNPDEAAR